MVHALVLAAAAALSPAQIGAIVDKAEQAFSAYPFPEVAARAVTMLKTNRERYEHLGTTTAFGHAINADLQTVTHDKHVHLIYPFQAQDADEDNSEAAQRQRHQDDTDLNFGFATMRRLRGNVGYLDFHYFTNDPQVAQTIAGVMAFFGNSDALIIDLRHNGGGSPIAAEVLEAYFFDKQQQITSLKMRDKTTGQVKEIQQYTAAAVPGPLFLNKPVYLLTGNRTFSCAEQFTYDLHNLHRVTTVGATTGGGANPGGVHDLGDSFGIFMPEGYAYSPVTKSNWEGTGIAPDVPTADADALTKAYDLALHYVKTHAKNPNLIDEVNTALTDEATALAIKP